MCDVQKIKTNHRANENASKNIIKTFIYALYSRG